MTKHKHPRVPWNMRRAHPLSEAARRSRAPHPTSEVGYCLREVRELLNAPAAADDAIGAWEAARYKHPTSDLASIPAAAPIFWSGGSSGHGHIAVAARYRLRDRLLRRPRKCWSTDIRRPGYFDLVPIDEIHDRWGLTFLGWTEDLNGVRVYPNLI